MTYRDTISYLFGLQKQGIKFGLTTSRGLLALLGGPQERFRSVHVAGTNGKGSTAAFLASILRAAGYRVGLYTSPHLIDFTERIRVNGEPVSRGRVVELAARVRQAAAGLQAPDGSGPVMPTFFEVTTAMAFAHFAENGVELAVVEAGMGGRLDSTNVITPLVSVITNIDLEHTEFLGQTIEAIASEKAGIIKQGIPVVTGAVQPEAVAVLEREAARQGAPLHRLPEHLGPERVRTGAETLFDYRGIDASYRDLRTGMIGKHQAGNASLAIAAVECLRRARVDVPEAALRDGIGRTAWEGRLERMAERPAIYLDGAHNPASAAVLAEALRELKAGYRRLVLVIGILKDKDHRGILERLLPLADRVVATRPAYDRAMTADALAAEVRRVHGDVAAAATVADALARAREDAGENDLIVVTGSLYTVGDARALLGQRRQAAWTAGLKG
jgi:dihydrofolate synthase/folylpolyglutamate synthase